MSEKSNIISIFEDKKEKKERRGLRKRGVENSPISPPLDPRLLAIGKINERNMFVYPRSVVSRRKLKRFMRYTRCIHQPHNSNITRMIAAFQTG